jgi:hypothetical protein
VPRAWDLEGPLRFPFDPHSFSSICLKPWLSGTPERRGEMLAFSAKAELVLFPGTQAYFKTAIAGSPTHLFRVE